MNLIFAVFLLKPIVLNIHHLGELTNCFRPFLRDGSMITLAFHHGAFLMAFAGPTVKA
jgi:hypothetical protein